MEEKYFLMAILVHQMNFEIRCETWCNSISASSRGWWSSTYMMMTARTKVGGMIGSVNVLHYFGCNLLNLDSIFVFCIKECSIYSDSDIEYIDKSSITRKQGMWYDHMKHIKNKPRYNLLSIKHPLSFSNRMNNIISALQQSFMSGKNNHQIKKLGYCWGY